MLYRWRSIHEMRNLVSTVEGDFQWLGQGRHCERGLP